MNEKLSEEIAYHIFSNIGIFPSSFVDQGKSKSIVSKDFILNEKISFINDENKAINKNVYGCQISITGEKNFKMLVGDCTQDKDLPTYCLLIQLKDAPAYGIYMAFDKSIKESVYTEVLFGVNQNKKYWMPCTIYLQATLLAGMEQLRDLTTTWEKCIDYKEEYEQMLEFIKFHDNFFGGANEGEEA